MIMNPTGANFRQHCRVYSSMISACTIDWYEKWPEEALLIVANSFLREKLDLENREVNITSFFKYFFVYFLITVGIFVSGVQQSD